MFANTQRKNFVIALLIGGLAVPLLALAANGLIEGNGSDGPEAVETATQILSTSTTATIAEKEPVDYLEAACGADGEALVEKESDGTIDPIEQAALDALRPICEEAGTPLAAPPAPVAQSPQVVIVEQVAAPAPSSIAAGDDDHDRKESREHEDEEDEEDHEHEEHEEDDR